MTDTKQPGHYDATVQSVQPVAPQGPVAQQPATQLQVVVQQPGITMAPQPPPGPGAMPMVGQPQAQGGKCTSFFCY